MRGGSGLRPHPLPARGPARCPGHAGRAAPAREGQEGAWGPLAVPPGVGGPVARGGRAPWLPGVQCQVEEPGGGWGAEGSRALTGGDVADKPPKAAEALSSPPGRALEQTRSPLSLRFFTSNNAPRVRSRGCPGRGAVLGTPQLCREPGISTGSGAGGNVWGRRMLEGLGGQDQPWGPPGNAPGAAPLPGGERSWGCPRGLRTPPDFRGYLLISTEADAAARGGGRWLFIAFLLVFQTMGGKKGELKTPKRCEL